MAWGQNYFMLYFSMVDLYKILRREKKRQRFEKHKNGKATRVRGSVKLDFNDKRDLLKKSGLSLQKTIEKLVKQYLRD